jgi:hypothetical protein
MKKALLLILVLALVCAALPEVRRRLNSGAETI